MDETQSQLNLSMRRWLSGLWRVVRTVIVYSWISLNLLGSIAGWGSGASLEDTKGFIKVLQSLFVKSTSLAGIIQLVLLAAALTTIATDLTNHWAKLSNWFNRPLGDPAIHFRRYLSLGVALSVMAMCIGVLGMETESRGATVGWATLTGIIAFVAVFLLSIGTSKTSSGRLSSISGGEHPDNDTQPRRSLAQYLSVLQDEGEESIRAWRNNELTFEDAQQKSKYWFMQVYAALHSHPYDFYPRFSAAVKTHVASVPRDEMFKAQLDNSHQERVGLYQSWQARLSFLPEIIKELNDGKPVQLVTPDFSLIPPQIQKELEELREKENYYEGSLKSLRDRDKSMESQIVEQAESIRQYERDVAAITEERDHLKAVDEARKFSEKVEHCRAERMEEFQNQVDMLSQLGNPNYAKCGEWKAITVAIRTLEERLADGMDSDAELSDWLFWVERDIEAITNAFAQFGKDNGFVAIVGLANPLTDKPFWEIKTFQNSYDKDSRHAVMQNRLAYFVAKLKETLPKYEADQTSTSD